MIFDKERIKSNTETMKKAFEDMKQSGVKYYFVQKEDIIKTINNNNIIYIG